MATKKEQLTRMQQKHDIEAHWRLAENFIPMAGEIIVYDPDEVYDYARFKCGDGVTYVNDLPFIFKIDENYATKEYVNNAVANITIEVDSTLTKEGEAADAKAVGDKFDNYETKENVQKITDELTKVKETAEAARTEEEVNTQIDAKIGALELKKTYEPIGAETRAKAYADDLMTDANLNQYTTEKEVKEIVDTIVADAISGDAVTGLANLVEYFHTHGEEAAQMGAAITELEGDVKALNEAPSAGIKATDISAWNGEIGAKALAATKTTAEEVKTQIEAYDYATKTYVNDAVANVSVEVDSTLTQAGKAADAKMVGDKFDALIGPYSEGLEYTLKDNGEYELTGIGTCLDQHVIIPSIVDGKRVTSIGNSAFRDCIDLTSITIPDSVIMIGYDAFYKCSNLQHVTIPDSVTTIGSGAFQYCARLANVTIPNSVIYIHAYAFADCTNLASITIPDSVISIGACAFDDCDNLTIYSEAKSQPIAWDSGWNYSNCPVVWGVALDFAGVNEKLANCATIEYVDNALENISYNDLIDKPFGEVEESLGDTVTWDGNLENFTGVVTNSVPFGTGSGHYVKISDCVPTFEELNSSPILSYFGGGSTVNDEVVTPTQGSNGYITLSGGGMKFVAVVPEDNFIQSSTTFPEKGIYFLHISMNGAPYAYATKLTIPNYSFGSITILTQIDKKYLPTDIATTKYVDDAVANAGSNIELDTTLTQSGKAADAKAVGDALESKAKKTDLNNYATGEQLDYVISAVSNEFSKLFNETFIPGEDVGETLTWDGAVEGREYYEEENGDGSMYGVIRWVHVSDSVPTLEQLSAGCRWGDLSNLSGEIKESETIFNSEIFDIVEDDNCIKISYKDPWAGLFSPVPYIVKTAHVDAGVVYNQPGIYFMTMDTNFMGSVRNTFFTIPGYNFRTPDRVLKVFKDEYMPVGSAGDGIIDVDTLPTENINEKSIYRVKEGLIYYNFFAGEGRFYRHGTAYIVDELPEIGEPCTLDGETVNAVYYERKSNNSYVYVPSSIAPALGVDAGWYTTAMLMDALGYPWGGIVTSLGDMNEPKTFYFLKKPYYGVYSNGAWTQLSNISWNDLQDKPFYETKQELGDTITWDGNIDESKDVITNPFPYGVGELRFVKVSNSTPTIDDIGSTSTINYTNGGVEKTDNVRAEDVEGRIMVRGNGDFLLAVIIRTDNTILDEIIFPKKGVYFALYDLDEVPDTRAISLTIPNYNFVNIALKQIDEKYLSIFEKVKGATVNVGEILTWDGSTEGKIVIEYHVPDTNGYGITMDVTYVKVSDSIPTYDEIMAGSQVLTVGGNGVGTSSGTFYVVQENDQRITIGHGDGLYATPRIIKTPHTDSNGLTWPEAGVYFTILKVATQDQSNEDRTQSFTITGYDFIVQEPDKNVIKDELIQVDNTLTQEGKPADAKAVGDRLAAIGNGGGSSGGGIIDVTELPTTNIDENAIYRLMVGNAYFNGIEQAGKVYIVNGLPETGEDLTTDMRTLAAVYYNIADGVEYGYISEEVATAAGMSAGWYPMAQFCAAIGFSYGGVVFSKSEMSKNTMYLLLWYKCYYYKNGWRCTTRERVITSYNEDNETINLSDEDVEKIINDPYNVDIICNNICLRVETVTGVSIYFGGVRACGYEAISYDPFQYKYHYTRMQLTIDSFDKTIEACRCYDYHITEIIE